MLPPRITHTHANGKRVRGGSKVEGEGRGNKKEKSVATRNSMKVGKKILSDFRGEASLLVKEQRLIVEEVSGEG